MNTYPMLYLAPHQEDMGERRYSFMLWPLYPQGKCPYYLLDRRLGGHQSWSGHSGKQKMSLPCPCQELSPSHQAYRVVRFICWKLKNFSIKPKIEYFYLNKKLLYHLCSMYIIEIPNFYQVLLTQLIS
jgi:hypothetical protein